jgi:hypothetical protein
MSTTPSEARPVEDVSPDRHRVDRALERATSSQWIALLIVVIALLGALASWRASVWAGEAAQGNQRAAQERIVEGQIGAGISSAVAHRRRLWQAVRARRAEAAQLELQARDLGVESGGRPLHQQAQAERAAADFMRLELGPYPYSASADRRWLEENDPELAALRPAELEASAVRAHDRKRRLVILYICFVASVVLLTFALLEDGRRRSALTATGIALSSAALVAFALPVVTG